LNCNKLKMFNVFEFEKRVNQSQKEIQRSQSDARHRQHAKFKNEFLA